MQGGSEYWVIIVFNNDLVLILSLFVIFNSIALLLLSHLLYFVGTCEVELRKTKVILIIWIKWKQAIKQLFIKSVDVNVITNWITSSKKCVNDIEHLKK